jgi:hypothetical protein
MKHALRLFQPFRDNSDVNPLFPKAVLATIGVAFGICGWPRQAQCDNRMLPQHSSKPESAKRLYTAKRMMYLLFPCADSLTFATITGVTNFCCRIVSCVPGGKD